MSSIRIHSQLCTAIPNSSFGSVSDFILAIAFLSHQIYFSRNFVEVITRVCQNDVIHIVFTNNGFFEVGIESWLDWDLNPRPHIRLRCSHQLRYYAMSPTHIQSQIYRATPLLPFRSVSGFISIIVFVSWNVSFNQNLVKVITWV